MYRLFVAVDLPDGVRNSLGRITHGIPGARWVPSGNFHLSLRFIGEVDGAVKEDIQEALNQVQAKAFELNLRRLGTFPLRGEPRVLWVGVLPCPELMQLKQKIERQLSLAGMDPDPRKFAPHVTLARLKHPSPHHLGDFLSCYGGCHFDPIPVQEFRLYASTLSRHAPHYEPLATYALD